MTGENKPDPVGDLLRAVANGAGLDLADIVAAAEAMGLDPAVELPDAVTTTVHAIVEATPAAVAEMVSLGVEPDQVPTFCHLMDAPTGHYRLGNNRPIFWDREQVRFRMWMGIPPDGWGRWLGYCPDPSEGPFRPDPGPDGDTETCEVNQAIATLLRVSLWLRSEPHDG